MEEQINKYLLINNLKDISKYTEFKAFFKNEAFDEIGYNKLKQKELVFNTLKEMDVFFDKYGNYFERNKFFKIKLHKETRKLFKNKQKYLIIMMPQIKIQDLKD